MSTKRSQSGSRPRHKFTAEFKAEAVAMVEASGGQIAKVAGWSLAEHMRTSLVADALTTAVATRGGGSTS